MNNDVQRSLGRIESKLDEYGRRLHNVEMTGERLLEIYNQQKGAAKIAGATSGIIGGIIAAIGTLISWKAH